MEKWYDSNQDISDRCLKCGSPDIQAKKTICVEWAPAWATYLASVGVRTPYKNLVQRMPLQVGYCKKHKPKPWLRKIVGYSVLLLGCILIGVGALEDSAAVQFTGVCLLFMFLIVVSGATAVRAKEIRQGKVLLLKPIPEKT